MRCIVKALIVGGFYSENAMRKARSIFLGGSMHKNQYWFLLFVLIRQGLREMWEGRGIVYTRLIVGGLYSEDAMRKARSKGTVYTRHQSKLKHASSPEPLKVF